MKTVHGATIAILLPLKAEQRAVSVHVVDEGEYLALSKVGFHQKLCENAEFSFIIVGFYNSLKRLREKSLDSVKSVARIAIPFPVQTNIVYKFTLPWVGNATHMVYVDHRQAGIQE